MQPANPHHNPETCQVGVMPVQAFESDGIPITPEMLLAPRRGRPDHCTTNRTEQPPVRLAEGNNDSQEPKDSAHRTDS
jgi:hypothetical protein